MSDQKGDEMPWTSRDLDRAALDVCAGFSTAELRHLHSQGGLTALVEATKKAEKQFRWYGDLHAAKPDPEKAARNYECADMLAALLPPVGEGETAERHLTLDEQQVVSNALRRSGKVISDDDWRDLRGLDALSKREGSQE